MVLLFAGCQKDLQEQRGTSRLQLIAEITEDDDVKTYLSDNTVMWGEGEYVKLWYNDGKDNFVTSESSSASASAGKASASFDFNVTPSAAASYTFGGVYPASCVVDVGGIDNSDASAYKVTLPSSQTTKSGTYDPAAYLMIMKAQTQGSIPSKMTSSWKRGVALNVLTLKNVPEAVHSITFSVPGANIAGKAKINLSTGEMVEVYEGSESVTIIPSTALPAGKSEVMFTSWDAKVAEGEQVVVQLACEGKSYTKSISARQAGINLNQGMLNLLSVDFTSVEPDNYSLNDFATEFVKILDVWKANTGTITVGGGDTFEDVLYVPAGFSFKVGAVTYNRTNMFDVAVQGIKNLYGGATMASAIPSPRGYSWGDNPYNEGKGNGGEFRQDVVTLDFIRNFIDREETYAADKNRFKWSNFCTYTNGSGAIDDRGTPSVAGKYQGVCCLERGLLIMARFYKYLFDNEISENIATACKNMEISSALYGEATPVPETQTIKGFATEFVKILDKWESTTGTVKTQGGTFAAVHYVPTDFTITVNGETLDKSKMFSIAAKSLQALVAGGKTSDKTPAAGSEKYSADPWYEPTAFSAKQLAYETIVSLTTRQLTYASSHSGTLANYCSFPNSDYDAASKTLSGMCSLERLLLTYARFFDYLLDNNIESGIPTACAGKTINCDLYGGTSTIYGYVKCGSTPLKGVVVSDGYIVTATDANGMYKMDSAKKNGYVFISVPSGYRVSSSGVKPVFYKSTTAGATVTEQIDFSLNADGKDQTKHTMLIFGDMHLANRTSDRTQFKTFTTEINKYITNHPDANLFGLTLGDMAWDCYWYANDYDLNNYLTDVKAISGLQIFHTIGNHDHDMNATGDWNTVKAYKKALGPNYYSFNIGKVHYMSIDNIECTNAKASKTDGSYRTYNCTVVDYILDWIKKDLAYVDKSTPIVVTMHCPNYYVGGSAKVTNADELTACFNGYTNVRYISGHTHNIYNCKKSAALQEFNSGAVCGTWWWGGYYNSTLNLSPDGSPSGYRVMTVNGTTIKSYYKGTGRAASTYQFRSYDRNKIKIVPADYGVTTYASQFKTYLSSYGGYGTASTANQVLINVWDYNTNWKVEASEDNKTFKACTRVKAYDPLFLIAYTAQRFKTTSSPSFNPNNTYHMFTYTASTAKSTVYIKVTDDEGREYTETMTRPKTFSIAAYK